MARFLTVDYNTPVIHIVVQICRFFVHSHIRTLLIIVGLLFTQPLSALEYNASLSGVSNAPLEAAMKKASLTLSSDKTISSMNALRLRANTDIDRIKNVAIFYGYYNCKVYLTNTEEPVPSIQFRVLLGDQFTFNKLTLIWSDEDLVAAEMAKRSEEHLQYKGPCLEDAPSFQPGQPALGKALISLDNEISSALRSRAFAFTKIIRKEVYADPATKTIDVLIELMTGPIVRFGKTSIVGAERSKEELFSSYQTWHEGDLYSPKALEQTENELLHNGVFQSVQIEEGSELQENGDLPITIAVTEGKPRTVGAGLNYTSTFGAGVSVEWEHRNIRGLGQKLSTQVQLWERQRIGMLTYTLPHFYRPDQALLWIFEYDHQNYLPFTSSSYSGSALLNKQLTDRSDVLFGLSLQRLESWRILHNTTYHLIKFPVQYRWSCANSPLDPTRGLTFNVRFTPSHQRIPPSFTYLLQNSTVAGYTSILDDTITFAAKFGFANISGAAKREVPLPDRFFGGSENTLRGYKTGSISPRNEKGQPIGGYSMATASLEMRLRMQQGLGWVLFYDLGNVYRERVPRIQNHPLLQSAGIGARYSTPIGPLRLDIAFPFNRRRHIDSAFQIYFSIGQAF